MLEHSILALYFVFCIERWGLSVLKFWKTAYHASATSNTGLGIVRIRIGSRVFASS